MASPSEEIHEPESGQLAYADSARYDLVRAARDLLAAGQLSFREQATLRSVIWEFGPKTEDNAELF